MMTGNENTVDSEITVNELIVLKDRNCIYCELRTCRTQLDRTVIQLKWKQFMKVEL